MRDEYDLKGKGLPNKYAGVPKRGISIRLPEDLIEWMKEEGRARGMGYQTFAQMVLRSAMVHGVPKEGNDHEERLKKLEQAVFHKSG